MPIPDLETVCVELTVTPQRLSIAFPGGASIDPELPDLGLADPVQLSKQLLAQANAALAPLGPVFNLVDIALALVKAVNAIPDAIALVNVFAELAGLGPLPELSSLGSDAAAALQPLEDAVKALQRIRAAIPV